MPAGALPLWRSATVLVCIFLIINVAAENKKYQMQSLCKNHFLQGLYRKIEGATLRSRNERNLDCVITFQTHSILQRFMLRFDLLQLDCNDHLYIYDGAHAVGAFKADLSCRQTKEAVGAVFTRTNFVTLKYVTDGWGTDSNGFDLVITAVKDPKHSCKEFTCTLRKFCIATDLVCDGTNHCADGSDESISSKCSNSNMGEILGMSTAMFVVTVVCVILVVSAIFVALSICFCRSSSHHPQPVITNSTNLPMGVGANGAGGGGTKIPGNWDHPAGPIQGYIGLIKRLPIYYLQAN